MFKVIKNNQQIPKFSYILLLLFIVSQSLAYDLGCNMETSGHDMSTSKLMDSNDAHAGHNMPTMQSSMVMDVSSHTDMSGCCDSDCQCAQNTCASSYSITAYKQQTEFDPVNHTLFFYESEAIQFQASSALYRPPIIC